MAGAGRAGAQAVVAAANTRNDSRLANRGSLASQLRDLMWQSVGPVREGAMLRDARRICAASVEAGWQMRLAKMLLRAARLRQFSLGAHYRINRGCPS